MRRRNRAATSRIYIERYQALRKRQHDTTIPEQPWRSLSFGCGSAASLDLTTKSTLVELLDGPMFGV